MIEYTITARQFEELGKVKCEAGEWEPAMRRILGPVLTAALLHYVRTVPNAQVRFAVADEPEPV